MAYVMLVGTDTALLEGLAQLLGRQGHRPIAVQSLEDAKELALATFPLVLVADRAMVSQTGVDLLAIPVLPGGARVLYRHATEQPAPLLPSFQRAVLADLTLPLERHRLAALVQSVDHRAKTTGRGERHAPHEKSAD